MQLADGVEKLKAEFMHAYKGASHLHEAIPIHSSDLLPIDDDALSLMHSFAKNNPIYFCSSDLTILNVPCKVYEGDINEYWLNSIKHDTSYQPFYPTWILSAYTLVLVCKSLGFEQLVDIGSGDGRLAYCAKMVGLEPHGLEIDDNLVALQDAISLATGVQCGAKREDATRFDYTSLGLTKPVFFISGLPELGEMLANSVIKNIISVPSLKDSSGFVFMGSHALKKYSRDLVKWGWGTVIDSFGLDIIATITLPTHWTTDQAKDTPYVFTRPAWDLYCPDK